jgi:hypothetical protein
MSARLLDLLSESDADNIRGGVIETGAVCRVLPDLHRELYRFASCKAKPDGSIPEYRF